MEKTLVLIKPDGIKRKLVGEIIRRYEKKNLKIVKLKMVRTTREILEKHYAEHAGKSFYEKLIKFMLGDVIAMVIEGENAVELVRKVNGATNPINSLPGTIRGDYSNDCTENLVHGSDCLENAKREIKIWFKE